MIVSSQTSRRRAFPRILLVDVDMTKGGMPTVDDSRLRVIDAERIRKYLGREALGGVTRRSTGICVLFGGSDWPRSGRR